MSEAEGAAASRIRGVVVLLGWLLAVGVATAWAAGWPTDNRVARWVGQLGADEGWQQLVERFGGDEVVLVRVEGADLDSEEERIELAVAGGTLAAEPAVLRCVHALTSFSGLPTGAERQRALAEDPHVRELGLVDADGTRFDYWLSIDAGATPAERAGLAEAIEDLREESAAMGWTVRAAGHPLVAAALDDEARRVERTFAPALALVAAIATWFLLRSFGLALAVLLPAAFAASAPRAVLRALGVDSDLLLVAIGPLGFVLLLASTLHLVVAYARHRSTMSPEAARRAAVREKLPAGLLAALTTAIGFGVFATSDLRSVATLGTAIAITMVAVVPLAYLTLPWLFGLFETRTPRGEERHGHAWRRLAGLAVGRRFALMAVAALLLASGAWAAATLPRETNALHYFPDGHRVRDEFLAIEAGGTGLSTIEVVVGNADGQPWSDVEWLFTSGLAARLERLPGVSRVFGPEVLEPLRWADGVAVHPWALLSESGRLDADDARARWTVSFPTTEAGPTRELVDAVRGASEAWVGDRDLTLHVTGSVPAMLAMQDELIVTLATSLGLTLVATTLCFLVVARRPRPLVAAVVANLFPAAAALTAARVLAIPLDSATVMVAAVVLGLAVDNTFHLLHAGRGGTRARLRAFERVGHATCVSSLALTLGFGALALSGFAPTARFGLLCAIGTLAALVGDLVVLPALWVRPRGRAVRGPSTSPS